MLAQAVDQPVDNAVHHSGFVHVPSNTIRGSGQRFGQREDALHDRILAQENGTRRAAPDLPQDLLTA